MKTAYLHPYPLAHPRLTRRRTPTTPTPADIIVRVGQLAQRLLADPVGERLTQQRLADEQLLQHRQYPHRTGENARAYLDHKRAKRKSHREALRRAGLRTGVEFRGRSLE